MNFCIKNITFKTSLILCWAILCFKPVLASAETLTLDSNNDNIGQIGSAYTYDGLIVNSGVTGAGASIENGGQANIYGTLTKVDGGENNKVVDTGSLTVESGGVASNIDLENARVTVNDGGTLNNVVVNGVDGAVSDLVVGNANINGITVNSGTLIMQNSTDRTGGTVDNIVVNGGAIMSHPDPDKFIDINNLSVSYNGSYSFTTNDTIEKLEVYVFDSYKEGSIKNKKANNLVINSGSSLTVKNDGEAENITVNGGGTLIVGEEAGIDPAVGGSPAKAKNIIVDGGDLKTETGSLVTNLTAINFAEVDLADNTLAGNLTIGSNATGFNPDKLFVKDTNLEDLHFVGGQNSNFSNITNTDDVKSHKLFLESGEYEAVISGWDGLSIVDEATLNMTSDITLNNGADLVIDNTSSLKAYTSPDKDNSLSIEGNIINNGVIDLTQNSSANEKLFINGNYTGGDARLNLNMNVKEGVSDTLVINGTASGKTDVYLVSVSDKLNRNNILFAEALSQGNAIGEGVFNIWRAEGSIYEWDTLYENGKWYAKIKRAQDGGSVIIVPEIVAYYGLIDNTFMQTTNLGASLRNNLALSEYKKAPCKNIKRGMNAICRTNKPVFSGWFAPATSSSTVESPFVYDAEINGFDGGLDLLSNGSTKLGLLASYREGSYNYEKDGEGYKINGQAETTINSYLAGAYLRHDGKNWSTILSAYAGKIDAEISTNDDVTASTSGTTYGATLDVSYIYKNINGLRIEPGVRISYTAVEFDAAEDNAGKTQEFDNASRTEIEAGIKFAKRWEFPDAFAEIFVKPSIVKIMDSTSDFELDEEFTLSKAEDRMVAKVSAGMSFDMTSNISASLSGSYSAGDDYTNTSGNLSVMYKF